MRRGSFRGRQLLRVIEERGKGVRIRVARRTLFELIDLSLKGGGFFLALCHLLLELERLVAIGSQRVEFLLHQLDLRRLLALELPQHLKSL